MIIKYLHLTNFRNYRQAEISFNKGTNVLFGHNGQGKTNVLESIYYLALTKSFRTSLDKNLICYQEAYFRIEGELEDVHGRLQRSSIAYSPDEGKRLNYNGQIVSVFSEYIGSVSVVLLAPMDLEISQGGPYIRRRFLDIMLSQASNLYLHHLIEYRRALKQRNVLLQSEQRNENLIQSWEEALIQNGMVLIQKRMEAVESISQMVKEYYQELSGRTDKIKIVYQNSVMPNHSENLESAYAEAFNKSRSKEYQTGSTSVGPHRDDLLFLINGKPLRVVGSQGEHKTFVISLKMAEFFFLQRMHDEPPILLFDDIFGELDADRITNMIHSLSNIGQVFLTTTSPHFFGRVSNWNSGTAFYGIEQGHISEDVEKWENLSH
jgi:DNA replication and repair protein RecF